MRVRRRAADVGARPVPALQNPAAWLADAAWSLCCASPGARTLGALADALKWAAARAGVPYDSAAVSDAAESALSRWPSSPAGPDARPEPEPEPEPARRRAAGLEEARALLDALAGAAGVRPEVGAALAVVAGRFGVQCAREREREPARPRCASPAGCRVCDAAGRCARCGGVDAARRVG